MDPETEANIKKLFKIMADAYLAAASEFIGEMETSDKPFDHCIKPYISQVERWEKRLQRYIREAKRKTKPV